MSEFFEVKYLDLSSCSLSCSISMTLSIAAFALFYTVSFARRPWRLLVVLRDCFRRDSVSKTGRAVRGMVRQLVQTRRAALSRTR